MQRKKSHFLCHQSISGIKDLQCDFRDNVKVLDNIEISDNLDEINILSSTIEFVKQLKLKHESEILEKIQIKVKKYEEK